LDENLGVLADVLGGCGVAQLEFDAALGADAIGARFPASIIQ
jgi:hypothetical protein